VTSIPHRADFDSLLRRLGPGNVDAIRRYLDDLIDNMPPTNKGHRTFGSSQLGSDLSPWQPPLDELYSQAWEFLGDESRDEDVEGQAALWFGLFIWERIMERDEPWIFWDPNLSATDPNREPLGKVYFERAGS
jgi:hypothetical protein